MHQGALSLTGESHGDIIDITAYQASLDIEGYVDESVGKFSKGREAYLFYASLPLPDANKILVSPG